MASGVPFLRSLANLWEPEDSLPPSEILLGTVAFVFQNYCGEIDAVLLDDLLKYRVFLLPPIYLCHESSATNFLSQVDLTALFFAAHKWPRQKSDEWHKHMDSSWILTIRKETVRGAKVINNHQDVAFLLFHLPSDKNDLDASDNNSFDDNNAIVEFVCVANGLDGTISFTPERKSYEGLNLDFFLFNVLGALLSSSLPEDAPCSITTLLIPNDDNQALLPPAFVLLPQVGEGEAPASFLQDFWNDEIPEHFNWNQQEEEEASSNYSSTSMQDEEVEEEEYVEEEASSMLVISDDDQQDGTPLPNNDEDSAATNDEGPDALLRKQVDIIFNSHDPNSFLEEEIQDRDEISDSDFEKCKSLYEQFNQFPEAFSLVDDPRVDSPKATIFNEALSMMFDIDSCLVHAATPSETAMALNGVFLTVNHPFSFKRNAASNRLLVKTEKTLPSGQTKCEYVDMAKFPNIEIAKLSVSEHSIEFTMNMHIIDEQPPSGNIVEGMEMYAWNAALNCARKHYKNSPFYQSWLAHDDKKVHAQELEFRLSSTNAFEVRPSSPKPGFEKKHYTPIRFSYLSGCLFLIIVWEKLLAIASKDLEPHSTDIRYPEEFGSSQVRQSSIQEAAANLYRTSHTVAQSAGFRHQFPSVVPLARPPLSDKRELHRWINREHQISTKRAASKLFSKVASSSAVATLDIGINFLSVNKDLLILLNGFKAQKIVRATTKVTVEQSKAYYHTLEHPEEQDVVTEPPGSAQPDPFSFVGRKTSRFNGGQVYHGRVSSYVARLALFIVVYVGTDGTEYEDQDTFEELLLSLDDGVSADDDDHFADAFPAAEDDYSSHSDDSVEANRVSSELQWDTEEAGDDGRVSDEFVMPNSFLGGPAIQRATYPQFGTTGHLGNAQNKPYLKLKVNHASGGVRVIPVATTRCTPMAQMYMPFAKFFPNKVLFTNFFKSIWQLTLLCLQCFSPLHTAVFKRLRSNSKKRSKVDSDPVSSFMSLLKILVQCLEDYKESILSQDQMYSRWEITITIDLSALDEEVPTLPILPGNCPLDALVVVEVVSFRTCFSNFLCLMTRPLGAIANDESSFTDMRALLSPNAKAAIICLIEMAVNTVGGGGVGKASILGKLLHQKTPGSYDNIFLSPLSSDLTKISRTDHLVTGLFFGISPDFLGFQYEFEEATDCDAVTISKTTEYHVSKFLKCPNSFLECLQQIFGRMVSAPPNDVEHSHQTVSFLQELEFPRIAGYNLVQVKELFKAIAGFLLKLYRSEWASIIASKCSDFPFDIPSADGLLFAVSSAADLYPHLVGICCDRTLNRVWPWIKPHLTTGSTDKQKIVQHICESVLSANTEHVGCHHSRHAYFNLYVFDLSLFFYPVLHTAPLFLHMFNGFDCSQDKKALWNNSPSEAAYGIVLLHLFRRVSSVKEEVTAYYGMNPFSNGLALAQQITAGLVAAVGSRAGSQHCPIIWRTQPTNQTRYAIPLEVRIAPSQLLCSYSQLTSAPPTVDSHPSPDRLCRRDIFPSVLKGQNSSSTLAIDVIWAQKISRLLQHIPSADQAEFSALEAAIDSTVHNSNVLQILYTQIKAYHAVHNAHSVLLFETVDATADHLFSRLHVSQELLQNFRRTVKKLPFSHRPSPFVLEIASPARSRTTTHASHFSSSIMPTNGMPKLIWDLQSTECDRLIGLVRSAGLLIVNQPREEELQSYSHSFGTLPLYIADRFGIWCPKFTTLLLTVYELYENSVLRYQNEISVPEKTKICSAVKEYLYCFSFEKINIGPSYMLPPEPGPNSNKRTRRD